MPSEIRWEPMGDHAYRWHSDWWVPDGSIEEVGEGFLGVEVQYGRVAHGPDEGTWAVWIGFDHATHGDRKMVGLTKDEAKRRAEVLVRAIREVWPEEEML